MAAKTKRDALKRIVSAADRAYGVVILLGICVGLPLAGRVSWVAGGEIFLGLLLLSLLTYVPELFRGYEMFWAIVAGFVAFIVAPRHVKQVAFYTTTAQIVPILFVALAFEARSFRLSPVMDDTIRRTTVIVALGLAFAGGECLKVIATGKPGSGDAESVIAALVTSTTALVLHAVVGPPRRDERGTRPPAGISTSAQNVGRTAFTGDELVAGPATRRLAHQSRKSRWRTIAGLAVIGVVVAFRSRSERGVGSLSRRRQSSH